MMFKNPAKTTLIGLALGLWLAASTTLILMLQEGASEALQSAAGYVADLPTQLFIEQLGMPADWQFQLLFIYCAVIGAFLGWLAGMGRVLLWILFLVILAHVVVFHWFPELVLEQGPLAAFDSARQALIGDGSR